MVYNRSFVLVKMAVVSVVFYWHLVVWVHNQN